MSWTKPQSRAHFLDARNKINDADVERQSALIASRLMPVLTGSSVKCLHAFLADGSRKEVDTFLLRQLIHLQLPHLIWAAPRIIPGTRRMEHYVWDDTTVLTPNRWGIKEPDPDSSQVINAPIIDAVLVPLLAYDQRGNRVGYGGGYYDRFLAQCRPDTVKIGLSFFEPLDEISDVDAWDIRLDFGVTPFAVYHWGN